MTEKWIITGGCGFIGSNLAAALIEDGIEVVVMDTLVRVGSSMNLQWLREKAAKPGAGKLTQVPADTRSQTDIDAAFERHAKGVTAVAHLAGQVAMTTSLERPRYDFEVNVLGAINVLEAIRRFAAEATVMFSSTNKVYGDLEYLRYEEGPTRWVLHDHPNGLDESTPLDFQSPYGCSKGAADQYFLDYHRMFGLKTIVFRHSSIYGGRQYATYDQGWVGWFCQKALEQRAALDAHKEVEPFTISGDGKQVRDLLFAEDIVRNYRMAAKSSKAVGKSFNIGGGGANSLSLLELFSELNGLLGVQMRYERLPCRRSDQKVFIADIRKAAQQYGWAPRVGRAEGLQRMLAWAKHKPDGS